MKTINSLLLIGSLVGVVSCQQDSNEPNFPLIKAYYYFRVFNPATPGQFLNDVGFDTLTYRADDGSNRVIINRTLSYEVDYDTTIYSNVPADRVLEGYLSARKSKTVSIEVGLIDKSGSKMKLDYQLARVSGQSPNAPVWVRVRKEVTLTEVSFVNR